MTYKDYKDPSDPFPRKFVFLLASDATGGEERYFMELAIAMTRTSTKPIIINLKTSVPYKTELEKHGVTIYTSVSPRRFDLIRSNPTLPYVKKSGPGCTSYQWKSAVSLARNVYQSLL